MPHLYGFVEDIVTNCYGGASQGPPQSNINFPWLHDKACNVVRCSLRSDSWIGERNEGEWKFPSESALRLTIQCKLATIGGSSSSAN